MYQARERHIPQEDMSKPESPCYNCDERHVGCHSICDEYADYKDNLEDYKAIIRKSIEDDGRVLGYQSDRSKIIKRKYKR